VVDRQLQTCCQRRTAHIVDRSERTDRGSSRGDIPVNHRDDLSTSSVSVLEHFVVYPNMFKHFHNGQGGAWEDGLDGTSWRSVKCARRVGLGLKGLGDV